MVSEYIELKGFKYKETDYKKGNVIPMADEKWKDVEQYVMLAGQDVHFWLRGEFDVPKMLKDSYAIFEFSEAGEIYGIQTILYLNGQMIQGLDANHVDTVVENNEHYDVGLYCYTSCPGPYIKLVPKIKIINKCVEKLYYDLFIPYNSSECIDKSGKEYKTILKHLEIACNFIDFREEYSSDFYDSIQKADDYIMEEFYEKECGKGDICVNCVGHSHIDVAWLWTLAQTREKVQRSFSTATYLMKHYPEYKFMMTQG